MGWRRWVLLVQLDGLLIRRSGHLWCCSGSAECRKNRIRIFLKMAWKEQKWQTRIISFREPNSQKRDRQAWVKVQRTLDGRDPHFFGTCFLPPTWSPDGWVRSSCGWGDSQLLIKGVRGPEARNLSMRVSSKQQNAMSLIDEWNQNPQSRALLD